VFVVIKASLSTGLKGLRRNLSHASSRLTFSVTTALQGLLEIKDTHCRRFLQ
jgi:hypothetical protein